MPEANHIVVQTGLDLRGDVTVVITDTGVGIEPRDLPFVFDPFFTTKTDPRTPGLGLTSVRADVGALGGVLHLESTLGRGTRVCVTLPATSLAAVPGIPMLITREAPSPCLLAVADTPREALEVAQPFLEGHVRIAVATWDEAVERLALAERFDLVVCDSRSVRSLTFRDRVREVAPELRASIFDVSLVAPESSGIFARVHAADRQADADADGAGLAPATRSDAPRSRGHR
jgi:hypothetical protein